LIDKHWVKVFVNTRVHNINISLDSAQKSVHDTVRGKSGAFKSTINGLQLLLARKEKKGRGPKISINTVVSRNNIDDLGSMYSFLKQFQIDSWRLLPIGTPDKKDRPTTEQWSQLARNIPHWSDLISRSPIDVTSGRSFTRAAK